MKIKKNEGSKQKITKLNSNSSQHWKLDKDKLIQKLTQLNM